MNFELDEQQRDFAASIDAALGAADVPSAVRAAGDGDIAPMAAVWSTLTDLGVPALMVAEEYDGIGAHPVDLAVACERLGYWCVPGPVAESIAVAPILLAKDERSAALAAGELIVTAAIAPDQPRAVNADFAGLTLVGADGLVGEAAVGERHASVDPSRALFDVTPAGNDWSADTDRAAAFGALATSACLVGAAQAMLDTSVAYAKQRSQFGRVIGSYQAIKHKLADCYVKLELARSNAYYGAMMLTENGADLPLAAAAARIAATDAYDFAAKENIQTHGGIGFTWEADTQFHYRRSRLMALSLGGPMAWKDKLVTRLEQKNAA